MSVFRKIANATASVKVESTKESEAIDEELNKIEAIDKFVHGFFDNVQKKIQTSQADMDSEFALWNALKEQGSDWKKDDFVLGNLLSKTTQTALLLQSSRAKLNETIRGTLQQPLAKWSREDVRSAREQVKSFRNLHSNYSAAVAEVKRINSKQSVPLDVLQRAEQERDALKQRFDKDGKITWQSLGHVLEKGRLEALRDVTDYLTQSLEFFRNAVLTLEKIEPDIREARKYILEKEQGQLSEAQSLQENFRLVEEDRGRAPAAAAAAAGVGTVGGGVDGALDGAIVASSAGDQIRNLVLVSTHDVRREKQRLQITVNVKSREFHIVSDKGDKSVVSIDDLLSLIKASKNREGVKLKFIWKGKDDKLDQVIFANQHERDLFYEATLFTKKNMLANRQFLTTRRSTVTEDLRIFLGTWNMGNGIPAYDANLNAWAPRELFDLYVFSVQEAEYPPRPGFVSPEEDLFHWIGAHLGENYVKLASISLMQIRIVAWVRREHYYKITRVKTTTVATGLANVIGNKGAAALCFEYHDTRFCFIGSHLAARIDRKRLEVRNQNYRDILKGLANNGFTRNGLGDVHHEFDYCFWLGDLNYRIEMSRDDIIQKIMISDFAPLRKNDQLINERLAQNCFLDFEEPDLGFEPTYRFNRGDRTFSEEKMREPAWCDRIMCKAIPRGTVKNVDYNCSHALMTSDHSPVYGAYLVKVDLPAVPHVRDMSCKIVISDLRGYDLKPMKGAFADPYLMFQAPWLSSYVQTTVQEKTTNPSWEREQFVLFPAVTSRDFLNKRWIRIVVRDSKALNNDMGCGVVYLEGSLDRPMKFTTRIVDKARVYGHIQGTIQVFFSPDYEDPLGFDPTNSVAMAELHASAQEFRAALQKHKDSLPPQPVPTVHGTPMLRLTHQPTETKYQVPIIQTATLAPLPGSISPTSTPSAPDPRGPIVFSVASGTNIIPMAETVKRETNPLEQSYSYLSLAQKAAQQAQHDPTIDADINGLGLDSSTESLSLSSSLLSSSGNLSDSPSSSPVHLANKPIAVGRPAAQSVWTGARARAGNVSNFKSIPTPSSNQDHSHTVNNPPNLLSSTPITATATSELPSSVSPSSPVYLSSSVESTSPTMATSPSIAVPAVPAGTPAIANLAAYMQQMQMQQQYFLQQQLQERGANFTNPLATPAAVPAVAPVQAPVAPVAAATPGVYQPGVSQPVSGDLRISVADSDIYLQMLQRSQQTALQPPLPAQPPQ